MIEGTKVQLCAITKETVPKILAWVNKPELKQYTGTLFPVSDFEHERWIDKKTSSPSEKLFVIRDKESQTDIGTIGLKAIDYVSSNAELYISICESDYLCKNRGGFGSDAVSALIDFCFNRMNLHKVYLQVFASNERAIRCYKKVGFEVEGRLSEHHFSNGKYEDVLFMSRLRKT